MSKRFPKAVCSLDLETTDTDFKAPENSTLLFVGTKEYKYNGSRYLEGQHKIWLQKDLKKLERYLKAFSGVIIGHNILKFDYGVLSDKISLKGIIEKTVDTLATMWWKVLDDSRDSVPDICRYLSWRVGPELNGLSLDKLSRANLRKGKTLDPKHLQRIWRTNPDKVISYNARDCVLAFELWLKMLHQGKIRVPNRGIIKFNSGHITQLSGRNPWVSFKDWSFWRKARWEYAAEGGDFIPSVKCPRCGRWDQLVKFNEALSNSDWSEAQLEEWYAGHWGTAECLNCGIVIDWDEDGISIQTSKIKRLRKTA